MPKADTQVERAITLNGSPFRLLHTRDYVRIADSFVSKNKLAQTRGNGEARLYVGQQSEELRQFFGDFSTECFFLKSDLRQYATEAETEYQRQTQHYRRDISQDLGGYLKELENDSESIAFHLEPAIGQQDKSRVYVRSKDPVFEFLRKLALPRVSYLTILKLESPGGAVSMYFRLFLEELTPSDHPDVVKEQVNEIEQSQSIPVETKLQLIQARQGQGQYREKLLAHSPGCVVTGVSDKRMLIASHIKPWALSSPAEKIDPKNGLILTPTYDQLFDKGFISFEDSGAMIISPFISQENLQRLGVIPGKTYHLPADRERYLAFHREKIFKK